jgi:hypothetical protein
MRKTQALDPPVLSATAPVRPTTVAGIELLVFVPSPSSPNRLSPQQLAVPFASSAQLVSQAVFTPVAPARPCTATAVSLRVCVPSPNCPLPLLPST